MSDDTIKTMIYTIAALLSIYPIIEVFRKSKKWLKVLIIIFLIFFWYLTHRYKGIIDNENMASQSIINRDDSLTIELSKSQSQLKRKTDSTNQFLGYLQKEFNIIRDSNNKPEKNIYNTNIKRADAVQIGPHN